MKKWSLCLLALLFFPTTASAQKDTLNVVEGYHNSTHTFIPAQSGGVRCKGCSDLLAVMRTFQVCTVTYEGLGPKSRSAYLIPDTTRVDGGSEVGSSDTVSVLIYEDSHYRLARVPRSALITSSDKREMRKEQDRKQAAEERKRAAERFKNLVAKYGQAIANRIVNDKLWLGMTKEMAMDSIGTPTNISKSIGAWGVNEQWVYGPGNYLYFENGKLTSIQTSQ